MSRKPELLFVDDEIENLELFKEVLNDEFIVDITTEPNEIQNFLDQKNYDGILVDIHMPNIDGFETIKLIKRHITGKDIPIFVLSSDSTTETKLKGLKTGITDYLFKMMHIEELKVRIKNGLEIGSSKAPVLRIGNLTLNQNTFQVTIDNEEVNLTLTEYKMFYILANNIENFLSAEEIKSFVFSNLYASDNSLKVHMNNLRKKLTHWNHKIKSKRGAGYKISTT